MTRSTMRFLPFLLFSFGALAQSAVHSAADTTSSRGSAITAAEWSVTTGQIGTAAVVAAPDDPAPERTKAQVLLITNRSTALVCVDVRPRLSTCAAACGLTLLTCSGAVTDGQPITGGQQFPITITGVDCACLVASAAASLVTTTRVMRFPRGWR